MLSYRDRMYCSRHDCVNMECPRKLTEQVWAAAAEFGLPVAHADFSDTCNVYIKGGDTDDNTEQTT